MKAKIQNILLVDDSVNDVALIRNALTKAHLGNNIIVAEDGEEALDFLERKGKFADHEGDDPVLILLDIKMPLVDGKEVLKLIRSNEAYKKIPVVMLTSSRNTSDLEECYKLGANSYVVKPIDVIDFVRVVSEIGQYWVVLNERPV